MQRLDERLEHLLNAACVCETRLSEKLVKSEPIIGQRVAEHVKNGVQLLAVEAPVNNHRRERANRR